jgi:hypothetical protein
MMSYTHHPQTVVPAAMSAVLMVTISADLQVALRHARMVFLVAAVHVCVIQLLHVASVLLPVGYICPPFPPLLAQVPFLATVSLVMTVINHQFTQALLIVVTNLGKPKIARPMNGVVMTVVVTRPKPYFAISGLRLFNFYATI